MDKFSWTSALLAVITVAGIITFGIPSATGVPSQMGHRKSSQHHRDEDDKEGRGMMGSSSRATDQHNKIMDRFQRPRNEVIGTGPLKAAKMIMDKPVGLGGSAGYEPKSGSGSDVPNDIILGTHCQAHDLMDGIVSDPADCSRYYVCAFGQEYAKTCPIGLLWNQRSKSCDWPENVSCQNKNHVLENMVDMRCGRDKISCSSGNQCIFLDQLCDKKPDCHDGSDEITCDPYKVGVLPGKVISVDGGTIIPFCGSGHALCTSRTQCVIISQLCDGVENCPDGSDEGTTNTIISASLTPHSAPPSIPPPGSDLTRSDVVEPTVDDVVLVRVYGNRTEVMVNRTQEIRNMVAMWSLGVGSELHCTFDNGLCYGYAPGLTLTTRTIRDRRMYAPVARTLALMHASFPRPADLPHVRLVEPGLTPPPTDPGTAHSDSSPPPAPPPGTFCRSAAPVRPCLFSTLRKWASLILPFMLSNGEPGNGHRHHNGTDASTTTLDQKTLLLSQLPVDPWEEIDYLEKTLVPLGSPVVFCHNDLLLDNIIYNPDTCKMTFIDLEYGDFNYQAFDIANFFCEFAGLETVNYDLFPNRALRLKWLTLYRREWNALKRVLPQNPEHGPHRTVNGNAITNTGAPGEIDEEGERVEVESLSGQIDRFTLAPHLYWALWAILQSCVSDKSFDYFAYAKVRLTEYVRLKTRPDLLDK